MQAGLVDSLLRTDNDEWQDVLSYLTGIFREWSELLEVKDLVQWLAGSESRSVGSDSLQPHGLYSPWNSPSQNTGVGSLSRLQGIFPTQESNPGLPHCRQILYQLSHEGSPKSSTYYVRNIQQAGSLCAKSFQSCLTLCHPMDCSPPGSSIHGILQARRLEWVAITFSRGSSQPRDWSLVSCIAGRFFTVCTIGKSC